MTPLFPSVVIDLMGTFVFALSGATLAVRKQLDIFGVLVLAVCVGVAGGITRDLLLGDVPPMALKDTRFLVAALAAGLLVFFASRAIEKLNKPVMLLDAAGLGLFAVSGCDKALEFGLTPLPAVLLGIVTAVGGGVLRDVLVAEVPRVLREDVYALAALLGGLAFVLGLKAGLPELLAMAIAVLLTFVVRVLSVYRGWQAPRAPGS